MLREWHQFTSVIARGGLRRVGGTVLSRGGGGLAAPSLLVAALLAVQLLGVEDVNADASCRVPPSGLAGTVDEDGSVVLAWEASSCDPVNYAVYRGNRSEEGSRQQKIATVDGDTLTYTDTGVEAGATYRYRVRSNDEGPRSGFAEISVPEAGSEPAQQPNEQSERFVERDSDGTGRAEGGHHEPAERLLGVDQQRRRHRAVERPVATRTVTLTLATAASARHGQ